MLLICAQRQDSASSGVATRRLQYLPGRANAFFSDRGDRRQTYPRLQEALTTEPECYASYLYWTVSKRSCR